MLNFGGVIVLFALQSSKTQHLPYLLHPAPKKKHTHRKNVMFHVFLLNSPGVGAKSMQGTPLEKHVKPKIHLFEKENHLNHPPP